MGINKLASEKQVTQEKMEGRTAFPEIHSGLKS